MKTVYVFDDSRKLIDRKIVSDGYVLTDHEVTVKPSDDEWPPYLLNEDKTAWSGLTLEQYKQVNHLENKVGGVTKRRPTAVRADLSDMTDPYFAFDNGAEIHFKYVSIINLTGAQGYGGTNGQTGFKTDQQIDNVMSYLDGYLLFDAIQKAPSPNFDHYTNSTVVNPINNIDDWGWSKLVLTKEDKDSLIQAHLKFVQAWYAVGLFTDKQIQSLGVTKK